MGAANDYTRFPDLLAGDPVILDVAKRRDEFDRQEPPLVDARGGHGELARRLGRVHLAISEEDWLATRRQVVALLAQGCRLLRDLGIETEAAAVAKDDQQLDGK